MKYPTEAVLNGGIILQRLEAPSMFLRTLYFQGSGIEAPALLHEITAKDLIQFCPETNEIIVSRYNLSYAYYKPERSDFLELMEAFIEEVFHILK